MRLLEEYNPAKPPVDWQAKIDTLQERLNNTTDDLNATKTSLTNAIAAIETNAQIADEASAPIGGLITTVNTINRKVLELDDRPSGGLTIVETDYELISWTAPTAFLQVASRESKLIYQFYPTTKFLIGTTGVISHDTGIWIPVNYVADSRWIQPSESVATCYQRNLLGEAPMSISFDVALQDKSAKAAFSSNDFTTGYAANSYWSCPTKFTTLTIAGKNLSVMIGYNRLSNNRIIIQVQDGSLPLGSRQCWVRNVRINGMVSDYAKVDDVIRGIV